MSNATQAANDVGLTKVIHGAIDGVPMTLVVTGISPGQKGEWVHWETECGTEHGRMPKSDWEYLAGAQEGRGR